MKKYFIIILALAAVAVSCQKNNDTASAPAMVDYGSQIVFAANTSTKAGFTEVDTAYLNKNNFWVSAYIPGKERYINNLKVAHKYMGGTKDDVFTTGIPSPMSGQLDFYAIYPLKDSVRFDASGNASLGYRQNDAVDLVVSTTTATCQITEPVALNFNHALAQLKISAKSEVEDSKLSVVLDSVVVKDYADTGVYRFKQSPEWSVEETVKRDSVLFFKDSIAVQNDTIPLGGADFAKSFIPDGKNLSLHVAYRVFNGSSLVKSVSKSLSLKEPLTQGYRNYLVILLRPGQIEDIKFTITVTPWADKKLTQIEF